MDPVLLDLTVDRMMMSSSLPWKPSTELTRTSSGRRAFASIPLWIASTWAAYGHMMPTLTLPCTDASYTVEKVF